MIHPYLKTFLLLFIVPAFALNNLLAQELIDEIKIDPSTENKFNLSGPVNDTVSFHMLVNQNREDATYESVIYFYGNTHKISETPLYKGSEKPEYIAFHVNDSILTLVGQNQKGIVVEDVNYVSGEKAQRTFSMKMKNVFSLSDKTILVGEKINKSTFVAVINNAQKIQRTLITPKDKEDKKFLKELEGENIEFINDKQYVEVGPLKDFKGYFFNDKIYILNENVKTNLLKIYTIDSVGKLNLKFLPASKYQEAVQLNSTLKDRFLYVFSMQDHISLLNIYDIFDFKLIKTISYPRDTYGPLQTLNFNGEDVSSDFSAKKFHKSFIYKTGSIYGPRAYLAVNKTTEDDYRIKIGHVDRNTYKNSASSNFWWPYPVFGVNYNFSSGTSNFIKPYSAAYGLLYNAMANEKRKGSFFTVHLDANFNPIETSATTKYQPFDPDTYKEKFKTTLELKKYFFIPQGEYVKLFNLEEDKNVYRLYRLND